MRVSLCVLLYVCVILCVSVFACVIACHYVCHCVCLISVSWCNDICEGARVDGVKVHVYDDVFVCDDVLVYDDVRVRYYLHVCEGPIIAPVLLVLAYTTMPHISSRVNPCLIF